MPLFMDVERPTFKTSPSHRIVYEDTTVVLGPVPLQQAACVDDGPEDIASCAIRGKAVDDVGGSDAIGEECQEFDGGDVRGSREWKILGGTVPAKDCLGFRMPWHFRMAADGKMNDPL